MSSALPSQFEKFRRLCNEADEILFKNEGECVSGGSVASDTGLPKNLNGTLQVIVDQMSMVRLALYISLKTFFA